MGLFKKNLGFAIRGWYGASIILSFYSTGGFRALVGYFLEELAYSLILTFFWDLCGTFYFWAVSLSLSSDALTLNSQMK